MAKNGLKIFISVDLEGLASITSWEEAFPGKPFYEHARRIMTGEANAAIQGALAAGATEVWVRDAHGNGLNIIPNELHEDAILIREWSGGPLGMMEKIDRSFDAAVCIGYHAKASTPNATLKHTMNGRILDLIVNGVSLPELGWNGLIAGYFDVPIIFVSGDKAICGQAQRLFEKIDTVAVKESVGTASVCVHPQKARDMIRKGVTQALKNLNDFKPLKYQPPFTTELHFKNENDAARASWYPNAERIDELGVAITCDDFFDCLRFYKLCS